jgi:hypothetical protein
MISKDDAVLLAIYKLSGGLTTVSVDVDKALEEANEILSMTESELEEYKKKVVSLGLS